MVKSKVLFAFPKSTTLPADPLNYDLISVQNRIEGAFRLIEVNSLISNVKQPVLTLVEFYDTRFGYSASFKLSNLSTSGYIYTAISHVWDSAPDVEHQINAMADLDLFGVDFDAPHGATGLRSITLSWTGLIQMACAARKKGSDYFWLDLCCIDQPNRGDDEMAYQISIMADIYRYANNVIVMVGGAGCVQHADQASPWMDRAWTLQEAILNPRTFVCVLWPTLKKNVMYKGSLAWKFTEVNTKFRLPINTDACCLISLKDLLDMSDADQSDLLSNGYPSVNVLDGMMIRAGNAPRLALRAALAPSSQKQIRYTGVWRSMFMRTSTKAVDVVYSIMGIFNLKIDPFKKNRDPTFMFNDLIRKTAASPNIGAWAWLSIGGVTGNDIPPDPASGITPRFPHDELNIAATTNKPPEMEFAGRWEWVGHHVDHSPFYIKSIGGYNTNHNINFMTHSQPHIMNATMIPINQKPTSPTTKRVNTVGRKGVKRKKSKLKLLSNTAECIYSGDLIGEWTGAGSIQAVFVGTVGDMRKSSFKIVTATPLTDYTGWKYFLFFKYKRSEKRWYVVANGVWNAPTWTPSLNSRVIFNVGRFAQRRFRKWPADDSVWVDQRYRRFKHSYGVEALHEWLCTDPGKRKIEWIGSKRSKPPLITASNQWYDYEFCYDKMKEVVPSDSSDDDTDGDSEEDHQDNDQIAKDDNAPLDALLKKGYIHHLRVLSCSVKSSRAPHTSTVSTHKKIIQQGIMPMTYSYGGWSKAVHVKLSKCNVEGLMVPNPWEGSGTLLKYQVRILFGNRVMYVQMRLKGKTDQRFYSMYCVPYKAPGQTTPVRNEDSLLT